MCTVLLPPGDNPFAVNKHIISNISVQFVCCSSTTGTATVALVALLHHHYLKNGEIFEKRLL